MPKKRKPAPPQHQLTEAEEGQRRESRRNLRAFMRYDAEYEPTGPCRCVRCRHGGSSPADGEPNVGSVVEVVGGPFKGQLGYIDDEAHVELEEAASEYAGECSEQDLDVPDGEAPWSVGPVWAIVYLKGLLGDDPDDMPGYNLIPFAHLHRITDDAQRRALLDAMTGTARSRA